MNAELAGGGWWGQPPQEDSQGASTSLPLPFSLLPCRERAVSSIKPWGLGPTVHGVPRPPEPNPAA